MSTYNIACCYFPTTVMLVDDQLQHLEDIKTNLSEHLVSNAFTNPTEAVTFIKNQQQVTPFIQQWSQNLNRRDDIELGKSLEEKGYTHNYVDIDIPAIHHQIYSAKRFKDISVIVVDYSMPNMNGLEFCKQIKDLPLKKLMLTGQADHELGVKALNEGIIDKFILKGSTDFDKQLNKFIEELQYQYFCDLSDAIIQNLAISPYCCLDDRAFVDLFNKLRAEHNIIEYYLVKDSGCFLMLDIDGNPSWLAVKTEQDMQHDFQSATDNDAPEAIINDLKQKQRLIFQLTERDVITYSKDNWQQYSHPATKLAGGKGDIYFSFIDGSAGYSIDITKIEAYKRFLEIS